MTPINDPKWPERMIWKETVIQIYCDRIQGVRNNIKVNWIKLKVNWGSYEGQLKGIVSYSGSLIWSDQFWIELRWTWRLNAFVQN